MRYLSARRGKQTVAFSLPIILYKNVTIRIVESLHHFNPGPSRFPLFFISASGSAGSLFFRIYPHFDRGARPLVDLPLFGAQAASGIGDPHLDPEGPGRVDFVVRGQRVGDYI